MHRTIRFLALAGALLLAAAPASAAMRFGAQVFGSWNTVSMDDLNDAIDEANDMGASFDNIESALSFGVGPTLTVNDQWQFGVHFERLTPNDTEDGGLTIEYAANVLGASVGYWFPSASPMRFGLDGSLDFYTLAGELSAGGESADTEGSGVGFLIRGVGAYAFNPMVAAELSAGYRMADVEVDEVGGEDPADTPFETQDFNGISLRLGLNLAFGGGN